MYPPPEFDKFAEKYQRMHGAAIRLSGEEPEFFSEYKIVDTARVARKYKIGEDLKILDFGSGTGNSAPFFAKHFPRARLTCADVSERSMQVSKERFPGMAEYRSFDGERLPFADGSFDLVFTACVFHHIPEDKHEGLFREILRVLTVGGLLIVFEHNPRNPLTVRAVNSCPFDENAILIDAGTLAKRLKSAGFKRRKYKYRIFFPHFLRCLRFFEAVIGWLPFGAQYYVVGRKDGSV